MTNPILLQKKAEAARRRLDKQRADPRYAKVIGKLVKEKLLMHNRIPAFAGLVSLDDALWASQLEPRILELLPAILLKRPRLFYVTGPLPDDLRQVLSDLRKGLPRLSFRGIPAEGYAQWVSKVGRPGKRPSLLKTFRFNQDDLALLNHLRTKFDQSEIDLIRYALHSLDQATLRKS